MADIVGIVASGISIGTLAMQIVGCIQQILDLWSTINDAPENIQSLLEEIELLGNFLTEIDDEETGQPQTVVKIIKYCQDAADCIDQVTKDLAEGFTSTNSRRRHWIAVKAVLKEKKLTRCFMRLERAKSLLNLAFQYYTQ